MSTTTAWIVLIIAGLLEAGWAVGMKYTDGFTKLWPSVFTGILIIASMFLLAVSTKVLPIGTAYAVWTGIGAFSAAVYGIARFGESTNPARLAFLALLLTAIIGLKFTSGTPSEETLPTTAVEKDAPDA